MKTSLIIVAIVALVCCFPLAVIWAFNTLFHTNIPVTFATWAATLVLAVVVSGNKSRSSS